LHVSTHTYSYLTHRKIEVLSLSFELYADISLGCYIKSLETSGMIFKPLGFSLRSDSKEELTLPRSV
jgi:hypothetical protein